MPLEGLIGAVAVLVGYFQLIVGQDHDLIGRSLGFMAIEAEMRDIVTSTASTHSPHQISAIRAAGQTNVLAQWNLIRQVCIMSRFFFRRSSYGLSATA